MMIKFIAKTVATGVIVYAVAETLNRLRVADRVTSLADVVLGKLVPVPGDTQ
jgi:hypothetical protein